MTLQVLNYANLRRKTNLFFIAAIFNMKYTIFRLFRQFFGLPPLSGSVKTQVPYKTRGRNENLSGAKKSLLPTFVHKQKG
ncbi:hypothetical protein D0T87_17065 [Bacteroides sp. 51]|nr:hypothetical protein [Bacteroides sp. 51]